MLVFLYFVLCGSSEFKPRIVQMTLIRHVLQIGHLVVNEWGKEYLSICCTGLSAQ